MRLDTPRLLIRDLAHPDLDAVHEILDVDSWPGERSRAERARWLEWTVLDYEQRARSHQPPYGDYAVERRASGEVVGLAGLVPALMPFGLLPGYRTDGQLFNIPEVGLFWAVGARHRGHGYAAEAGAGLVDFAFSALKLARIVATTDYDNAASIAVMRRLGMQIGTNPHDAPFYLQVVGFLDNPSPPPSWPSHP